MESYIKPFVVIPMLIGVFALLSIFVLETNEYFKMNEFYRVEFKKNETKLLQKVIEVEKLEKQLKECQSKNQ